MYYRQKNDLSDNNKYTVIIESKFTVVSLLAEFLEIKCSKYSLLSIMSEIQR